jgi:NADPH-dependent curcumin reductase CurA
MEKNRRIVIAELPKGPLAESHYALDTVPAPEPGDGEVLCRTLALSIAAGTRAALQGSASYTGAPQIGMVMPGAAVSRVVRSSDPSLAVGDLVTCMAGWQDYSVHKVREVERLGPDGDPARYLGVLGINGLTAYFGLLDIGRPLAGETVAVSAAAGSVGHLVGQIARIKGARVIGVAGSDEKCALLTGELRFDDAVNYKRDDFRKAFKAACGEGIDVYFDNTGGRWWRFSTRTKRGSCGPPAPSTRPPAVPPGTSTGV